MALMLFTDQLLAVARAYAEAEQVDLSVVSSRVFDDSKKLPAVASGAASLTLRRAEAALAWFAGRWPAGATWPAAVPLPAAPETALQHAAGPSAGASGDAPAAFPGEAA
jgi:hypothetical protein